jgi:hypothetical protein
VFGLVEVFGGVLVFGGIAATDVAADQTEPQVDPVVADLKTLFATVGVRVDFPDLIQMGALFHG